MSAHRLAGFYRYLVAVMLPLVCLKTALGANEYKLSPAVVQRGDTTTITLNITGCPDAGGGKLDRNSLEISGTGIVLGDPSTVRVTDCSFAIQAQIANTAAFGKRDVLIYNNEVPRKRLAALEIEVVDILAGPIPPGLKPQVDVMYNILSESACQDQLGNSIAQNYYCIEVQLGNNTGYALLLSGVGFLREMPGLSYRESNSSYLQVRSVLQREQLIGGRNITLRGLQAAGVIIAGFTPFSGNAGRRGRIGIWSSLIGNVIAGAYDTLIPDRTIRQLSNLDDAALRDGKLIPNNSPVKFTVFVDRESIVPFLAAPDCYQAYVLGETNRELERLKMDLPDTQRAGGGQKTSGLAACEAGTIPRKGKGLNFLGRAQADREKDLVAVRRALGKLIIVGDQIEYKQRIRVDSTAVNPEVRPNPVVNGIENGEKAKQGDKVTLHLVGRWLTGATVTATNCITAPIQSSVDASGSRLTLTDLAIPDTCTDPVLHLIISTGSSTSFLFDVPIEPMKVTITKIDPETAPVEENKDATIAMTVTGTGLFRATFTVNAGGTAASVANVVPSATKVTFEATVPAAQVKDGTSLDVTVKPPRGDSVTKTAVTKLTKKP